MDITAGKAALLSIVAIVVVHATTLIVYQPGIIHCHLVAALVAVGAYAAHISHLRKIGVYEHDPGEDGGD